MKFFRSPVTWILSGVVVIVLVVFVVINISSSASISPTSTPTRAAAAFFPTNPPVEPVFNQTATPTRAASRPTQAAAVTSSPTSQVTVAPSPIPTSAASPTPLATATVVSVPTLALVFPTPSSQNTPTQGPPASYGFTALYMPSVAHPGQTAQVTIKTAPGATCSITVITRRGVPSSAYGLEPKTAGVDGVCTWYWKVDTNSDMNAGIVTISANNQTQSFFFLIQ